MIIIKSSTSRVHTPSKVFLPVISVVIVGIIGGISFPQFSSWSTDRKIRQDQEKISSLLSIAATQVERGSYSYVKVEFENTSPVTVTVKGVSKTNFSKKKHFWI